MVYGCDTARSAVAPWLASLLLAPAESSLKDFQVQLSRAARMPDARPRSGPGGLQDRVVRGNEPAAEVHRGRARKP